jgi:hypothetical protein
MTPRTTTIAELKRNAIAALLMLGVLLAGAGLVNLVWSP